jgi:hypothetical protein
MPSEVTAMMRTPLLALGLFLTSIFGGLIGAFLSPVAAGAVQQFFGVTLCSASTACSGGSNAGTGPGVQGTSSLGKGIVGQTKFNSTASSNAQAGVLGQDLATTGSFGEGVRGTSTHGIGVRGLGHYGVIGQANSNVGADFLGRGSAGALLFEGLDTSGNETFLINPAGDAFGRDINGQSITGVAPQSGGIGVYGDGSFAAVYATNAINAPNSAAFYAAGAGGKLYVGRSSGGGPVFEVDNAGNVTAHSFNAGFASAQSTPSGSRVMTYASESRSAIVEDFGEARLVGGIAYVRVDPNFTALMQRGTAYAVFVTPYGPVRGTLYVPQRDAAGFTVRETPPGMSNVLFDYRIVARRYVPPVPRDLDLRIPNIPVPPRPLHTLRP